jgi:hypothetical protein
VESFASKKKDKYIQLFKGQDASMCLSFDDKKLDLAYVNSKYATKDERKAKNINRYIQDKIREEKSDYYCVSSTPIKYKKGDKTTRDKLLSEYSNNSCNQGSMSDANSSIIGQQLTLCPKFYNVKLTRDERKRGIVAEIPCLKCIYNN